MHFVCKLVITAGVLCAASISSAAGQTASTPAPRGMVSDWTHRHVLYPQPTDGAATTQLTNDPRWVQSYYLRHPENWWPGFVRRRQRKRAHRDWSVPLGTAYYQPLIDSSFTFTIGPQGGSGVLTSEDLGGGQLFATAGTLTVSTGSDIGTYSLFPGGPGVNTSPAGAFLFDNLMVPSQDPVLDVDGLLFLGGGAEVNIWGNSTDNYSFYTYSGGTYVTQITSPGTITPVVSPVPDPGGGEIYPAKYAFDVNQAPSCTNDFVVVGIPTSRAVLGQANIIGLNNLYSNGSGTGFCPGTGPNVMFAYTSGTGQVPASVVISLSGQQVAYVENVPGNSFLHVLTIGTTGTNGTGATSPAEPGAGGGNNAADVRVRLTPDGGTTNQSSMASPFVVFTPNDANDVAYVTTYDLTGAGSGYLYKINNVFNGGTPSIVWSVPVTAVPSTPVYDRGSNKIFFTDSAGRIDYVLDSGASPSVVYGPSVAPGTTSENPVIVDSTRQMVYALFNSNGTNAIVVQAPTTLASTVSVTVGAASTTYTGPYLPDFNHAWYSGSGTPMMFVAGTGTGTQPTLYGVGFTGSVMNNTAASSTALTTGTADASPVSEFFNTSLGKDLLFVGVTNNCIATTQGGTAGCIMSLDITSGFPTVNASTTALAAPGGTSGIIPDNISSAAEASSVYYVTKGCLACGPATLVKATQSALQ